VRMSRYDFDEMSTIHLVCQGMLMFIYLVNKASISDSGVVESIALLG
jgi:hypothetical protein